MTTTRRIIGLALALALAGTLAGCGMFGSASSAGKGSATLAIPQQGR